MDVRADTGMTDISGRQRPRGLVRRMAIFAAPFLILAGAAGGFALLRATAPKPEKNDAPALPIAVEIATARSESTPLRVSSQGEVKAKSEADVAAQVSGELVEISARLEPGAFVEEDEVIARIDPEQYRLAVMRSRSQVARARESLTRARSEADLAMRDWKDLGLTGDPSDLTLQKPQVNAAIADLKTAEAAVKENELSLARAEIRAPFDGRVKARTANVGDFVAPGEALATIFAVDVAQVRIPLKDADLAVLGLEPGFIAGEDAKAPEAHLSAVVAGAPRKWTGRLKLIEAAVDPQTRLVYGLVEVADPFAESQGAPLAPGLFVNVEISGSAARDLVAIPRSALKKNQYIYVVDKDFAIAAREVTPSMGDATTLYFNAGLRAGEKVVASFLPSPYDGMKVRDINAPTPKADAGKKPAKEKVAAAKKKPQSD